MDSSDRVHRDQLLRAAVLGGDERAWETWYEEAFDGLYAYVRWRCAGLKDRSDEVVQETWLTAVRRVRQFDPRQGTFSAWVRGIAQNVLRNHLRRHKAARRRFQSLDGDAVARQTEKDALECRDRAERIAFTLDALPERYEAVLQSKYLDGLSVAQIAHGTDQTVKAVESLLARAREKFREVHRKFEANGQGPR